MLTSHNMANIFLVSQILLLFHYLKALEVSRQNKRNLENICHIVLGTVR